jgi:hypothetical protein
MICSARAKKIKRELVKIYKRCGDTRAFPGTIYRPMHMKRRKFDRLRRKAQQYERALFFKDDRWIVLPTVWRVTPKQVLDKSERHRHQFAIRTTTTSIGRAIGRPRNVM